MKASQKIAAARRDTWNEAAALVEAFDPESPHYREDRHAIAAALRNKAKEVEQ